MDSSFEFEFRLNISPNSIIKGFIKKIGPYVSRKGVENLNLESAYQYLN